MAKSKSRNIKGFADIQTYEELEAAIRQVKRQQALNRESATTYGLFSDGLFSGGLFSGGGLFGWTDILRFGIRLLRKRLLK